MPVPRELPQQIPATRAKAEMQKPHGGGKFLEQIPRGAQGVMAIAKKMIASLSRQKAMAFKVMYYFCITI